MSPLCCRPNSFTNTGLTNQEAANSADVCGDLQGQTTLFADVCGLKVICDDPSGVAENATVKVASCTTYRIPGANRVCNRTNLYALLPGSPSKCKCELTDFGIIIDRCSLEADCLLGPINEKCAEDVPPPETVIDKVFNITSDFPCGGLAMSSKDTNNGGSGCPNNPLVINRVYTLSDDVDATANLTCNQTITVVDDVAPVLIGVPNDVTVECDAVPGPSTDVNATDNCSGNPVITFNETRQNGGCPKNYTLTRTWTATDSCGNSNSKSQVVTVVDTTAPVIQGCPQNVTINICSEAVPEAPELSATDNCDDPVTVGPPDCCFDGTGVTRTWSLSK